MSTSFVSSTLLLSLGLLLVSGCQDVQSDPQEWADITGTLNIEEGDLQDITEARVILIDDSIADASYELIAETSITELDHPPIEYSILYNPSVIQEKLTLMV